MSSVNVLKMTSQDRRIATQKAERLYKKRVKKLSKPLSTSKQEALMDDCILEVCTEGGWSLHSFFFEEGVPLSTFKKSQKTQ